MFKEDVVSVCNGILLSCKKKKMNEISPFATTWMDLKDIMLSEIRQRQFLYDFSHMSKKQNK